jgi:hypothetical protein
MQKKLLRGTGYGILFSLPLWALIIMIALITISGMQVKDKPAHTYFAAGKPAISANMRAASHISAQPRR